MPARKKSDTGTGEIEVMKVATGSIEVVIRGTSPLLMNRMSEKVRQEMLLPSGPKNRAERAATLKHNPHEEFQATPYRLLGDDAPTLLGMPAGAFKRAIAQAALDIPGAEKSKIGRLLYVKESEYQNLVPIYGEPQLFMTMVRQAGMRGAPDVRTRAILPEWAARLHIEFVMPTLRDQPVLNLLAAAGIFVGVGDNRPEKGHDSFGQWEIASGEDDPAYRTIDDWGRKAQEAALASPALYDDETERLLGWFDEEAKRRGFKVAS